MKECTLDGQGAVVAHHKAAEVSQPADGTTFYDPSPPVGPQRLAILCCSANTIALLRANQFDPAWGAGRDFLPLRFGQQRSRPCHWPSLGSADSAYRSFQKFQPPPTQWLVPGCSTASSYYCNYVGLSNRSLNLAQWPAIRAGGRSQ
jgi:hypothetical protein